MDLSIFDTNVRRMTISSSEIVRPSSEARRILVPGADLVIATGTVKTDGTSLALDIMLIGIVYLLYDRTKCITVRERQGGILWDV